MPDMFDKRRATKALEGAYYVAAATVIGTLVVYGIYRFILATIANGAIFYILSAFGVFTVVFLVIYLYYMFVPSKHMEEEHDDE